MRRITLLGLVGAAGLAVSGCGAAPAAGPSPATASNARDSAAAPTERAAGPTTDRGSDGIQADALAVFDALRKTDEAFAAIGLAPFKLHAGQRTAVIVGGRTQRTTLGEQPLQEDGQLAKAHEALGLLWGARNRTIRLEFDGGRIVDARPDAARSAAEKAYLEFLDSSSARVETLYEKYWTKMPTSTSAAEIDGAFPALARVRTAARDVFLLGAEHGMRSSDDWKDRAKISWARAQDAGFVKAARARVDSSLPDALTEAKAAGPELAEAITLEADHDRAFKAAATELQKRIDAGEPIPKELSDVASSIAQANEMVRRLRADAKAPPEKRKTLANIDEKLPAMRRVFCAAQRSYVDQHGLGSFQKASTMLCKTSPPEFLYRNQPVAMEDACLEAYRTHCP